MQKNPLLLVLALTLYTPLHGSIPLANGCAVESVAFTVEYLEKNPTEHAFVFVLEPAAPGGAGHAVCVYGKGDLIYAHDLELGDYCVGDKRTVLPDLRGAVSFRNRQILTARARLGLGEMHRAIDESAEVGRAFARLPRATRPVAITIADREPHQGVAFLFDQKVWIYLPKFGCAQMKFEGVDDYATAIRKNLAFNFPRSRLLRIEGLAPSPKKSAPPM